MCVHIFAAHGMCMIVYIPLHLTVGIRINLFNMDLRCYFIFLLPFLPSLFDSHAANICTKCDCNNKTMHVNCSNRLVVHIPQDPTGKTELLNLTYNNLGSINDSAFVTYRELKVLDLSQTGLNKISPNAFVGLSVLQRLNLSMNEQLPFTNTNIPTDVFKSLTSLEELKIFGNTASYDHQADVYPDNALAKLPQLGTLWIDGHANTTFGPEFRNMKSLWNIYLPGHLTTIWRFCRIPVINEIMLSNLIHITNLTMRRCAISDIKPNAFKNMGQLRMLDLSHNILLTFDAVTNASEGLSNTNIEYLYVNHIYQHWGSCGVWITIDMAQRLGKLKNLKELHVELNTINGFVKGAIEYLPPLLQHLNAKMNYFEFSIYAFETFHLNNLISVDLSFNQLPDTKEVWYHEALDEVDKSCQANTAIERKTCAKSTSIDLNSKHSLIENFLTSLLSSDVERNKDNDDAEWGDITRDPTVCKQNAMKLPPKAITPFLPRNVKNIDISHSKYAYPIPELYFDENNTVTSLIASASSFYCWDGPVYGLTRLEYLDLSLNLCHNIRKSFFDQLPSLKTLIVASNVLADVVQSDEEGRLLKNLVNLEHLDMSDNKIEKFPSRFLIHQRNLKSLNLLHNALSEFQIQIDHFVNLSTLDLGYNSISTLSEEMRRNITDLSEKLHMKTKQTFKLNLVHNKLHCYCNSIAFLNWAYDHMATCRFLDINVSYCLDYNYELVDVESREQLRAVLDILDRYCKSYTGIIAGTSVAFCVMVVIFVSIVLYRFRWKMTYWYYVKSRDLPKSRSGYISIDSIEASTSRYKFDLYISSIENTKSFVLESMKQILEDNHFRVFVQDDDIIPGQSIYSTIANAIHISRTVVFVVSETCDENKEWNIAMRMAHEESLYRGYPVFFGVFIGSSPEVYDSADIREIKRRSYLSYPNITQPINDQTFWHDLIRIIKEMGGNQVLTLSEIIDSPSVEETDTLNISRPSCN